MRPSKKLFDDFSVSGIVDEFFGPLRVMSKPMEPSIPVCISSRIAKLLIDESFDLMWEVVVVVSWSFGLNSQASIRTSFDLNKKKVKTSPMMQSMMLSDIKKLKVATDRSRLSMCKTGIARRHARPCETIIIHLLSSLTWKTRAKSLAWIILTLRLNTRVMAICSPHSSA